MPLELIELAKLLGGIIALIIPGYLWSFMFSKHLTKSERLIFGFIVTMGALTVGSFTLNIVIGQPITQNLILFLYLIYSIPIYILYGLSIARFGFTKPNFTYVKKPHTFLLLVILGFAGIMMFLPHLVNSHYLPFHVDEWIHWAHTQSVIMYHGTSFVNPFWGSGTAAPTEIGFQLTNSVLHWMTTANLNTIFVFMPAIIGIMLSLSAYNIGQRSPRKYGLEAAFLISFIPTTIRYLGPSFWVAITLGLLILLFVIWLATHQSIQETFFTMAFLWYLFLIHPPTAVAGIIIIGIYTIFLVTEKQFKIATLQAFFLVIPLLVIYYFTSRWDINIEQFLSATYGDQFELQFSRIWVSFEHLGIITWILFILGTYFSFTRGKAMHRTLSISGIGFIIIIGLYDHLNYGVPIIYERTFMYLFLIVTLIAGFALAELRTTIATLSEHPWLTKKLNKHKKLFPKLQYLVPLIVIIILLTTSVPAHINIPYYTQLNEQDYETALWLKKNLPAARDNNHSYDRVAIDPFKAAPFSAVSGLYIAFSSMHPLLRQSQTDKITEFLKNHCNDTSFLNKYKISVIYAPSCNNSDLTKVYTNVYLY
ncbi:MAG: hypothetical protein KKC68_08870 [Candidatus Thermoplasmatota archaeon]|nr:hypothetical protein [Candidatus Thermoplasmatota archaeon]MBU1941872.1 hypothetical protein [Candidatus Thermoplasmatota archaeon]